jgi:hypothetical protein
MMSCTCNFNARNVNENIEPLLIEQPLLNTNSTEDACICTNNTVVNIDLNESTDIVENVYCGNILLITFLLLYK